MQKENRSPIPTKRDLRRKRELERQRIKKRNMRVFIGFITIVVAYCVIHFRSLPEETVIANAGVTDNLTEGLLAGYDIFSDTVLEYQQKCVMIDPGHGGMESPGCVYKGVLERELNLKIAVRVKELLEELGYKVAMMREDDVYISPKDRAAIAENSSADALISIHHNALEDDTVTEGMETLYNEQANKLNSVLAKYIQNETANSTKAKNRGIVLDSKVILIREVSIPSCLIEVGFLSSDKERALLISSDYQEKVSQGIVKGIEKFFQ